jgi:hypothetical protein
MKKQNLVLVALLGLIGTAAGCGGGDAAVAFTEDVYCNERAAAECGALNSTCAFSPGDTTACIAKRKTVCAQEAASLKSPPKRIFREGRGKECVSKSRSVFQPVVTASAWLELREVCSRTFEGLAKSTEACEISLDCESGLICDKGFCGRSTTVGTDAGCANAGEQCKTGQFCSKVGAVFKCTNRLGLDAACDYPTNLCVESLRCLAGVCKPRLMQGDACAADADCAELLLCDPFTNKCSSKVNLASQCSVLGTGGVVTDAAVGG